MRILIIRFSSLGDIILTEAVIRNLRNAFPNATIDYVTKPIFKDLVKDFLGVDRVFTEYKNLKSLKRISSNNYDIVIDLHAKLNSFITKHLVSSKQTITYNKKRGLRKKIVSHSTNEAIDTTVDLYFSVFDKLNIQSSDKYPRFQASKSSNLLANKNKHNIVIFPGATHETKRMPQEKIIELISYLKQDSINFYLLGTKSEEEIITNICQAHPDSCINLAGKFSIVELINAVSEADLVITNDSGPMHIASALSLPQIAFFGATNTRLGFRPLNDKAQVISLDLECSPCSLHGTEKCPLGHFDCMKKIDMKMVADKIQNTLNIKKF